MVSLRRAEREAAANERVELLFYKVTVKDGDKIMKPLKIKKIEVPIAVVKAILASTIVEAFYERLSRDLLAEGVEAGTTVQMRAKFSASNTAYDPAFKGTHVLCEVKV
ncbi:MAG: hypothetical protein Q7S22_01315 [Candidatus Micrarchaeota archaeon]|nr:hypothetical protein [Candidatus Micrarchaeota archaeon]